MILPKHLTIALIVYVINIPLAFLFALAGLDILAVVTISIGTAIIWFIVLDSEK